tara:strand:- start:912 stop:1280 length:369 start_codon:yes stop_codon:yes gene_type:complete
MWVVSTEDKTVASTWGATVRLVANEPKQVGDELGLLCLQNGCSQVKEPPVLEEEEAPVVEDSPKIDEGSGGAEVEVPVEASSPNFNSMTKVQLEEYGRTIGIELDRRKKKASLIEELEAASS